ncbi:MAG: hypothetical protein Q7T73_12985 [Beijerinckiaceae bacterium]|nr:hypothetical protein [Beijerinckiaceae bacterium]
MSWDDDVAVPMVDLDALPGDVRAAIEAAIDGQAIVVHRSQRPLGTLGFLPLVPAQPVVPSSAEGRSSEPVPARVMVVATTMPLSDSVRRRLSDDFGPDYIVVDIHDAPPTTDVLLTTAISPQLIGQLRGQFPDARIVITEIEDDELGVRYSGPVSRMLAAGASAYVPPRPIAHVAASVKARLAEGGRPMLAASADDESELTSGPRRIGS